MPTCLVQWFLTDLTGAFAKCITRPCINNYYKTLNIKILKVNIEKQFYVMLVWAVALTHTKEVKKGVGGSTDCFLG
jgi:hypothetical protein